MSFCLFNNSCVNPIAHVRAVILAVTFDVDNNATKLDNDAPHPAHDVTSICRFVSSHQLYCLLSFRCTHRQTTLNRPCRCHRQLNNDDDDDDSMRRRCDWTRAAARGARRSNRKRRYRLCARRSADDRFCLCFYSVVWLLCRHRATMIDYLLCPIVESIRFDSDRAVMSAQARA